MRRIFILMSLVAMMGRALIVWLRVRPIVPTVRWLLRVRPEVVAYLREINQIRSLTKPPS
ncbi:MAG: hypothetical protein HND46_01795 [Chloroflexi bacterium]|nr:hypothetical protein [Chloroflexota bacterium]NOG62126.1 hypothetical protein [Chloroflexota bacterium]